MRNRFESGCGMAGTPGVPVSRKDQMRGCHNHCSEDLGRVSQWTRSTNALLLTFEFSNS